MGTEAIWLPLAMSALGAGASVYNTRQTAKRQDAEAARQIAAQGARQREADALVSDAVMKQGQSNPDAERAASLDQYVTQLQKTQGNAEQGLGQIGAVSGRYNTAADAARAQVQQTGGQTADIYSRIDAPLRQRQAEGIAQGRLGSEVGRIGMLSDSDRYIGDMRMQGIGRNPWLDAAAGALQGGAGYMAGRGGGVAGAGASAGPSSLQNFGNNMDNFMAKGWKGTRGWRGF